MKKIFIFSLALALPAGAYASGAGTTAAPFLKAAMSPRAVAIGAFSPLADDSGAIFVNPAGLALFDAQEIGVDFASYFQDAKLGNLSYAGKLKDNRFGVGVTVMNVPSIDRRSAVDVVGAVPNDGSFDSNDLAVTLAYAKKNAIPDTLEKLDAGFSVKFIKSSLDKTSAYAFAADAGAMYRATPKTRFSLALQNLGNSMKFKDVADPLPLSLKAGMLYQPTPRLNLSGELGEYFLDEKFYPAFGAEYWFRDSFAIRGGYKFGYDTANLGSEVGLSLGFGLKVAGLGIDYAYLPFGDLGTIHRLGFWMQF